MALSITDLLTPMTKDQVRSTIINGLVTAGIPADKWRKGGALSTIVTIVSGIYAGFSTVMSNGIAAGFLETASGGWLTLLARYVFNVERPLATYATGSVNVSNTGGGVFNFIAGQFQVRNTVTKMTYANQAPFALNPGDMNIPVAIEAAVAGTVGNANPGDIDELVTNYLGLTVTNPAAVVGSDEMSDADLRTACSSKLGTLSNGGPRAAYQYAATIGATAFNGGIPVNINRVSVSEGSSTGVVTVYLASPSGVPIAGDVAAATAAIMALARPDGVIVNVFACTAVPVARTLTVWSTGAGNVTSATLQTQVASAVSTSLSLYPIAGIAIPPSVQGFLYSDFVKAVAKGVDTSIFHVEDGNVPDLALNAGQVAVMTATVNVRIIPPS